MAVGIYKIESKINSKRYYIGSAVNINRRWTSHLGNLQRNKHKATQLQNHYNKYGKGDLIFSILCECEKEQLIQFEQYFLDFYNPYFNTCPKAGSSLGYKHTLESIEKMRSSKLGRKRCPHSEVTKKIMSEQKLGDNNPAKRPEVREKIRNTLLGRKLSKDSIIKRELTKINNRLKNKQNGY